MNIFKQQKIEHFLSDDPREFSKADCFLLPGVGAFDPTMKRLTTSGIIAALEDEVLGKGKRVLVKGGKLHSKYHITLPEEFAAESVNGIY